MKLAVHGATGRMGRAVLRLAFEAEQIQVVGGACAAADPAEGRDLGELAGVGAQGVVVTPDVGSSILGADVVIDFSVAAAVPALLAYAERQGVAVVSGTTNLDATGHQALARAARKVPVVWAPNMSPGVQVLCELLSSALKKLGPEYDVEIVELHHRRKVDAPSGTARRLANTAREVRRELREVHGREGEVGARQPDEMGVFGVRGGDVVGDHTVYLLGPGERIELTHRAATRDLFAHGALRAARFAISQDPGLYDMGHVLA